MATTAGQCKRPYSFLRKSGEPSQGWSRVRKFLNCDKRRRSRVEKVVRVQVEAYSDTCKIVCIATTNGICVNEDFNVYSGDGTSDRLWILLGDPSGVGFIFR